MEPLPGWFTTQLNETIEWCRPRVQPDDPKWCLRSPVLTDSQDDNQVSLDAFIDSAMIASVVTKRRHLLCGKKYMRPPSVALGGGRLLLCACDYTNHNGLTAHVTNYYLDNNDTPPWDTWVSGVGGPIGAWPHEDKVGVLVAWVPPEFVSLAETARNEECMGMLGWADQLPIPNVGYPFGDVPGWLRDIE